LARDLHVTVSDRHLDQPEKSMSQRPVIGVTTQTLHSIDGIPAGLPQSVVMNQRYYVAVTLIGAAPILIPLLDDEPEALRGAYDVCDGILIPSWGASTRLATERRCSWRCGRWRTRSRSWGSVAGCR
jgi:hypothetical protein